MGKETDETNLKKNNKPTYKEIAQQRGKEVSVARKIFLIIFLVLLFIIIVGGFLGYKYVKNGLTPVDPSNKETINVTIPLGSSTSNIASILEENGIIANSLIYRFYVKFNNASDFQAGDYALSPSMTLEEVTEELQTGSVTQAGAVRVTIPEGRNIEEIAETYEKTAKIDKDAFLEKMSDKAYIQELIKQYPDILTEDILQEDIRYPLEGYLFPATYQFAEEKPSIEKVVTSMLNKTKEVFMPYLEQIKGMEQFNMHDIFTFASLVEEEAPNNEDRRLISGVFYNRIDEGMRLQTDPTVIYAHGEHISRLTYDHYEIESPYNTYTVTGLPIGPIANFGVSSLQAVLEPQDSNYLYFLADQEGNVHYSTTYEEHQTLEEKYIHSQD
ncbi:endolytic transglycosylase MltG [Gracilibacillus dipsosauri]|uniref:endolytic transglycosylase MltG n=1 Tax=Gracilibacillus dipsosauri TaxID=178340 RepID=UPI00240A655C